MNDEHDCMRNAVNHFKKMLLNLDMYLYKKNHREKTHT